MSALRHFVFPALLFAASTCGSLSSASAQTAETSSESRGPAVCERPPEGSSLPKPTNRISRNGRLEVELSFRSSKGPDGNPRYCYTDDQDTLSPTLRVRPGDTLVLTLRNAAASASDHSAPHQGSAHGSDRQDGKDDPCNGGPMTDASTNVHFHGLAIPAECHQDETIRTLIQPDSEPFRYEIKIPKSQPPGLYWYHPHPHGYSERQVLGGASGALIVDGIEEFNSAVSGLPERVFVIRDQPMANSTLPSINDPNKPTKDLSINYVPVLYPQFKPSVLELRPSLREFWRVLNASADTFVDLNLSFGGKVQQLGLVALDGVPIGYDDDTVNKRVEWTSHVLLPPGGRAEFIIETPEAGISGRFGTHMVERGALFDPDRRLAPGTKLPAGMADQDDNDPARPLATIVVSRNAPAPGYSLPAAPEKVEHSRAASLASTRPIRIRRFYFSEELIDPKNPRGATNFYITEEGRKPKLFNPNDPPDVTVHVGDVEDWIIENRTGEPHTFHVHQAHFLVIGQRGSSTFEQPLLRDTINISYWNGFTRPYPNVRLRMDFRDPAIVGTFPFHCHILQHEDGGMMGSIRVLPRQAGSEAKP